MCVEENPDQAGLVPGKVTGGSGVSAPLNPGYLWVLKFSVCRGEEGRERGELEVEGKQDKMGACGGPAWGGPWP